MSITHRQHDLRPVGTIGFREIRRFLCGQGPVRHEVCGLPEAIQDHHRRRQLAHEDLARSRGRAGEERLPVKEFPLDYLHLHGHEVRDAPAREDFPQAGIVDLFLHGIVGYR